MTGLLACDLTLPDLGRMMADKIRNREYQSETRLGAAVAQYLAWKRLGASERTLEIYEGYLARLCIALAADNPTVPQVTGEMLLDALASYPPGSHRVVRSAYADFFKWACRWGKCDKNPVDLLPKIPKPRPKVYEVFEAGEQDAILKATDAMGMPIVQRPRVLAFLELGIRKEEGRGLKLEHFDMTGRVALVYGKGGKERIVPFSDELWKALMQYRNWIVPKVRTWDDHKKEWFRQDRKPLASDYLFFPYSRATNGEIVWTNPAKQVAKRTMHAWWQQYVMPASGVKYRSLHMNRHSAATDMISSGAIDLMTASEWLGHEDPATTAIYVHNSRARLQKARQSLDEYRKAQRQ